MLSFFVFSVCSVVSLLFAALMSFVDSVWLRLYQAGNGRDFWYNNGMKSEHELPPFEPYRIRMVDPIRRSTRAEREFFIREAGHNPFRLRAEQVMVDLVTDSGVSALSSRQWAAILSADESFAGSRSFYRFEAAARNLFRYRHVIPCHQGRAAEHLLAEAVLAPGDQVLANTLFATTRANFEDRGAEGLDLPIREARDSASRHPFKGNIDLDGLETRLADPSGRVRFVVLTVTDNSRGGQPVSLANLRDAGELCRRHQVPLLLDGARFAENAWLIKLREPACREKPVREIAREMFAEADGVFMSLKKDALGNSGGLLTLNRDDWAESARQRLLAVGGIPTAGGRAGRDLEALTVSLEEMLDEDFLAYRVGATAELGERLAAAGVPVLQPFGAHAVYVDGRSFCPHLPDERLPAWSLSVALYLESGVRAWETGNVMHGRSDPAAGTWRWPELDLLRLAIPRRVYTRSHLEYAAQALIRLHARRDGIGGLRFVHRPPQLPQFDATFAPA